MEVIYTKTKFNFLLNSFIFSIIGLFIPGFTAVFIFLIQMLFVKLGIGCSNSWKIIWSISWIGALILPYYFYRYFKKVKFQNLYSLKTKLLLFNFLEYCFLQMSIGSLLTSANTLCYVSDGQNGLELVFTAWLGLPILMIFSYIFSHNSIIEN